MILVVASQVDEAAGDLVASFSADRALLVTCADLSSPGWVCSTTDGGKGTFVSAGERYDTASVDGLLTLIPVVYEKELVHIHPDDRGYVASEMTAFLAYWLSELDCPKLNPPSEISAGISSSGRKARNAHCRPCSSTMPRAKQGVSASMNSRINERLTVSVDSK